MKGPFTESELVIIGEMNNSTEIGEIVERLTPLELIRLKSGEGISLKMIMRGRSLLEIYRTKAAHGKIGYVTHRELDLLREEHDNLTAKTMLIFMALERRGLISTIDLEEIAAEIRDGKIKETNDVRSTSRSVSAKSRGGRRGRKPKEAA